MGDDFANILQSNFGLRPSGKAAPMSNTKGPAASKPTNQVSNGRAGSGISSFGSRPVPNSGSTRGGTGPNLDIPDNFGATPSPRSPAGIFDAPRDIFADLSQAAGPSQTPSQKGPTAADGMGYDKLFGDVGKAPLVAEDDIFGGLGSGVSGASAVNDDVFGIGTSSSSTNAGVKVDDLLGNLGGMGSNRPSKAQRPVIAVEDDILGGLGAAQPSTRAAAKPSAAPKVPDLYGDTDPLDDLSSSSADPFGGFPGAAASNGAPSAPADSPFDDWGMPAPAATKPVSSQNRTGGNEARSAKPAESVPSKATDAAPKRPFADDGARSTAKPASSRQEEPSLETIPVAPPARPKYLTVDQIVLKTKPTKAPPPLRMPPGKPGERRPSTESRRSQPPPPSYKEAQQTAPPSRSSSSQPSDYQRSTSAPRSSSTPPPQPQGSGSFFGGFSRTSNSARSSDGDKSSQGTPRTRSGESTPTFEDSDTKGAASAASASAAAMAAALERAQARHKASYERKQRDEREQAKQQQPSVSNDAQSRERRPSNNAPPRPAAKAAPPPAQTADFFSAPPRRPSRNAEPDLMNNNHDPPKSYSSVEDLFGTGSRRNSAADDLAGSKQKPSSRSANDLSGLQTDWGSAFGVADPEADAGIEPGDSEDRRKAKLAKAERLKERADAALRAKLEVDSKMASEADERHKCDELYGNEIKRWASGKEGNLRALLSTLQFVLWPECDWKAVQMTDLITGASVKKVYQKAILRVHPDKVQQKGATVHQKYIAGKVFDLLKEAYNKFNSTELF